MDAAVFAKMLSHKNLLDLKKLAYHFPKENIDEFVGILKEGFYREISLPDFKGESLVYLDGIAQDSLSAAKVLLSPQINGGLDIRAMESEIVSTFAIEQIDTSRDSVRRILLGHAPKGEPEERIYAMKKGLEYIADPSNVISENSIHHLYQLAIAPTLDSESGLERGSLYRQDTVFVVGSKVEHTGLQWQKLPEYMGKLVEFIQADSKLNDLHKAAAIHFYIAFLHPWYDGNGRMARLLHLWYLVQRGYASAIFAPFSMYINESRKEYYRAYSTIEANLSVSGVTDITPFLVYFSQHVYGKLRSAKRDTNAWCNIEHIVREGKATEKELQLWRFVLSAYGTDEFSTKQLERDFGNAAYATIRSFVLKFSELGLLTATKYGNRTKYHAN